MEKLVSAYQLKVADHYFGHYCHFYLSTISSYSSTQAQFIVESPHQGTNR
jgi:hypothetical protein